MSATAAELIPGFAPEDDLERKLAEDPELIAGLAWGRPRSGHPEGAVGAHVADLLRRLDGEVEAPDRRRVLRLIALVHDSFKYSVQRWLPKTGENHHATRARRFAERYTADEAILSTIELHDRPYALWRRMRRTGKLPEAGFAAMMERARDPALLLRFVELDGSTDGKDPEPIRWFRDELVRRGYPVG